MRHYLLPLAVLLAGCGAKAQDQNQEKSKFSASNDSAVLFADANPIYVNQHGFSPESRKLAFYRGELDSPATWSLHNENGDVVLEGVTEPVGYSETAKQHLNKIDFSDFDTPGDGYYLTVQGTNSPYFDIARDLYESLKYDALAYFYHARAGVPIETPYVSAEHARPAGHTNEVVTCFKGEDLWGTKWPGCDYELDVTGGWYDAGDHGKYVVNAGISTWTLLNAYEQFGESFADGQVNIPEAGNGVNDLLEEARYNIEWMLSMQVPDGTTMKLPVGKHKSGKPLELTEVDASGMVHHKVHDENWTGNIMPHEDEETRYLYPPSTGATLNLAAIGAQCARIWREIDPDFSQQCFESATKALNATQENPDIFGYSNFDGGGPYGDSDFRDEKKWALYEYSLTNQVLGAGSEAVLPAPSNNLTAPGFNNTELLALLSTRQTNPISEDTIISSADNFLLDTAQEKLHFPYYSEDYHWGSNSALTNRAIVLGTAYQLTGEQQYRDGVVDLMDYLLGRNPTGYSYITGYGDKPYKNPHHRFWAKSQIGDRPEPPAGVLSGGPNNTNMSDPVAEKLKGKCAAQTCYVDDHGAWTLNEVTINWNAPLFWMAAFLDATEE